MGRILKRTVYRAIVPEAAGQEQLTSVGSEAVRREQLNICCGRPTA